MADDTANKLASDLTMSDGRDYLARRLESLQEDRPMRRRDWHEKTRVTRFLTRSSHTTPQIVSLQAHLPPVTRTITQPIKQITQLTLKITL
jgi:hypothetical protein